MAERGTLREVLGYFLRLGVVAFGGPAAHIAIMRRELVAQRRWMTDEEFVDHLGITNLIPGPNSTEMTMHLGARRAGWRGLYAGGLAFILPAVSITLVLAWAYVRWGTTPAGEGILLGVQPVILAVIVQAIWGLRTAAFKGPGLLLLALAVAAGSLAGIQELILLPGAGLGWLAWSLVARGRSGGTWSPRLRGWRVFGGVLGAVVLLLGAAGPALAAADGNEGDATAGGLFLVFLEIGSVLYGSGYVLVSFMETELVDERGWLTTQQLVDAIAVGQFTPGPLFSSATFAGYVAAGWGGALAATAGIFLPSFVFVTATHPLVERVRRWRWTRFFLDGVNAAAVALMAVVTVRLAEQVAVRGIQVGLLLVTAVVLVRWSPNTAILVLAGAAAGLAWQLAT